MNESTTRIDPAHTEPERGTIIVDASTLRLMGNPISQEYRAANASYHLDTYLDILPFLAEHGYRILIRSVSAYQANGTLAGCRFNRDDFFDNNTEAKREAKVRRMPLDQFLASVKADTQGDRKEYRGRITIECPEGNGEGTQWENRLESDAERVNQRAQLANGKKLSLPKIKDSKHRIKPIRDLLIKTNREIKGQQCGDDVIINRARDVKNPFVLCDNYRLMARATDENIATVNTGGLLRALERSGLFPYLGLQEGTAEKQFAYIQEYHKRGEQPMDDRGLMAVLVDADGSEGRQNNHPFKESMSGISEKLLAEKRHNLLGSDRIDRYNQRTGGRSTAAIIAAQMARQKKNTSKER